MTKTILNNNNDVAMVASLFVRRKDYEREAN